MTSSVVSLTSYRRDRILALAAREAREAIENGWPSPSPSAILADAEQAVSHAEQAGTASAADADSLSSGVGREASSVGVDQGSGALVPLAAREASEAAAAVLMDADVLLRACARTACRDIPVPGSRYCQAHHEQRLDIADDARRDG